MRILFTLHNFYPERLYGAEKVCIAQIRELLERGHDVGLFYACNKEPEAGFLAKNGLEKLQLYRISFLETKGQVLLSAWKPHVRYHFAKAVDAFNPDIIVFQHLVRLSLDLPSVAWRRRIPTVYHLHDFYPVCPSYSLLTYQGSVCSGGGLVRCAKCLYFTQFSGRWHGLDPIYLSGIPLLALRNRLVRRLQEHVNLFVSPSEFLLQELQRHEFTCKKSIVVPYAIPPVRAPKPPALCKDIRFGYLGNISKKKGIEVLAKAFRGSLARSLIIRGFPDESSINQFKKLFPGFDAKLELFDPDPETFYSKVDVVVVPSIWYENQPVVMIEAFAFGKVVLCSDLGGMAEMVENGVSGIRFVAGDADDLRAKATYLRDNPSEVFKLAASVPRWPTMEEQIDRLLQAYSLLM